MKTKKRKGFHGSRYADMQANSNNETSKQSTSSEIPPGAGGEDELPADIESKMKVIEKIVPLTLMLKYILMVHRLEIEEEVVVIFILAVYKQVK